MHILFATGNADLRAVVERVLTREGYELTTAAHSGHALLAGFECEHIDILVSELQLDGTTGETLATSLRRYHPAIRTIYMADAGTPPGPGVVVRPFTRDDLLREIEACRIISPAAS
jgi:DNA-binding response OmpR family regulator